MISSMAITFICWIIGVLMFLIPNFNLPSEFSAFIVDIVAYAYEFDDIIPVTEIGTAIATILIFEIFMFVSQLGRKFLNYLRGAGGI